MKTYTLILPNEKIGTYRLVTLLVLMMNTAVFGFLVFSLTKDVSKYFVLAGFSVGLLSLIMLVLQRHVHMIKRIRQEYALISLALIWTGIGNYFAAVCSLCFGIMGFYTHRQFLLNFSESGITYPSFPPKQIKWKEVDFVKLKDGVLTLELPENKSIQAVILPSDSSDVNEEDFNEFCSTQINIAKV